MPVIQTIQLHIEKYFLIGALALLIIFFSIASENFFSLTTLTSILNQLPALMVVAVGMTLVLMAGHIDLSVGSVLGLCSAVTGAAAVSLGVPLPVAFLLGILTGAICGLINGCLSSYFSLPSFIVTLGMLEMARGLAYFTTSSQTLFIGESIQGLSLPILGLGVSPALIIAIFIVVFTHFVVKRTVFGRYVIAIGTNQTAARMSGIAIHPYRISVLAISGVLAGLGGLFNAAYLGAADPNAGIGFELSAIAAAVIGGTSLMGGRGSVVGAFIGVLIIAVLQNGLAQMGATEPTKRLITGGVIIGAVLFDRWRVWKRGGYQ